jgi:hypothetical protein
MARTLIMSNPDGLELLSTSTGGRTWDIAVDKRVPSLSLPTSPPHYPCRLPRYAKPSSLDHIIFNVVIEMESSDRWPYSRVGKRAETLSPFPRHLVPGRQESRPFPVLQQARNLSDTIALSFPSVLAAYYRAYFA